MQRILRSLSALFLCAVFFSIIILPVFSYAKENEKKVIRVGWYESSYSHTDKFGRKTGMVYEYQQKIASDTNWTYEYVEGTWPELLQMLMNGEIDLLSDVSYTQERAKSILYPSLPMGTEFYYIYVRPDNKDLLDDDPKDFDGKAIAVNKGSVQEDYLKQWAEENDISINIVEIFDKTSDETIEMLKDGSIDALASLDNYGRTPDCVPVYKIGSSDYYFAVSKNRPDLLGDLNHVLKNLQNEDPFYNQRLHQKYIWAFNTGIAFTKDERDYLEEKKTITIGYRDNYQPFCFQENGELSGALEDFLEYASTCVEGMEVGYEAVPFETTEEALAALDRGDIDAVFPINMNPYDSEESDLFITTPVMDTEIYVLVKAGEDRDILSNDDTRVVLLEGNVNFDNFVKDYYPNWSVSWRSPLSEVYAAVASGEADCAMVNGYRLNANDRLRRRNNLLLLDTGEAMDFSFAVKRENRTLFTVIDKSVSLIDEAVVDTMLSRYTNTVNKVSFYDYLMDNWLAALAVTVLIIAIIIFLVLSRAQSEKISSERQELISATEHDPLTGLYTRNFFYEYSNRMYREKPENKMDAIVMNIEQFHAINTLYGWEFGDLILKAIGDEIEGLLKENEGIACRSQADRFEIYCSHPDNYQAVLDRFQKKLDESFQNVNIRLSLGVMPWQKDLEPAQLFDRATAACSSIRGGLHSRLEVFNEDMKHKEMLERKLINDLRYGIENHEFVVYYQPKYNIQTDPPALYSAEALVRWNHHELGLIPPGEFITLFEKSVQIGLLDRYVWAEVARQIKEWKDKYGVEIPISVNLSRVDIFDADLEKIIEGLVEGNGLRRESLHLEITESAYTEGEDQILDVINRFRGKGYHIEMDDFGTGYSSLNMLSYMSIDVLKLDRSFIHDIENDTEGKKVRMVELILDIAKSLKLTVVAEGVETEYQMKFLKERGCDIVQGYYFSKPIPAEEFEKKAFCL